MLLSICHCAVTITMLINDLGTIPSTIYFTGRSAVNTTAAVKLPADIIDLINLDCEDSTTNIEQHSCFFSVHSKQS